MLFQGGKVVSNDTSVNVHEVYGRIQKLWFMIGKMIMDGTRDPHKVVKAIRQLVGELPRLDHVKNVYAELLWLWYSLITTTSYLGSERVMDVLQAIVDDSEKFRPTPPRVPAEFSLLAYLGVVSVDGRKLSVRAFSLVTSDATFQECLSFLEREEAVLVGEPGVKAVFAEKVNRVPRGYWCVSFGENTEEEATEMAVFAYPGGPWSRSVLAKHG